MDSEHEGDVTGAGTEVKKSGPYPVGTLNGSIGSGIFEQFTDELIEKSSAIIKAAAAHAAQSAFKLQYYNKPEAKNHTQSEGKIEAGGVCSPKKELSDAIPVDVLIGLCLPGKKLLRPVTVLSPSPPSRRHVVEPCRLPRRKPT